MEDRQVPEFGSAVLRADQAAASRRRIAAISSGACTALPQSPGVVVTIAIEWPAAPSLASVPPERISTSSG
jgi:hypothetical protein